MPKVTFYPADVTIEVATDENLLRSAMRAGVHINASCGGSGVCNKCRIIIEEGEASGERLPEGGWKACDTYPVSDLTVRIPVESEMDRGALARPAATKAASWIRSFGEAFKWDGKPAVHKMVVELPKPSLNDSVSDLYRLRRELAQGTLPDVSLDVDSQVLYELPDALRCGNWKVTVSLMEGGKPDHLRLIKVEAGDVMSEHLALAVDIGTTTVSVQLLNLNSGEVLKEASDYNPQVSYGEDVISRMEFSRKGEGLKILQQKIVECLNSLMDEVLNGAGANTEALGIVSIAANSVMTHFLMGLDTRYLRAQPYTPVATHFPPVRAGEL